MTFAVSARVAASMPAITGGRIVLGLVAWMLLLKLAAVAAFTHSGEDIFNLGFSFDPYVRSILDGRGFVSCDTGGCDVSSRMPALPYFMAAMAKVTTSLRVASILKALLLSGLLYLAIRGVERCLVIRKPIHAIAYTLLGLFVVMSPNLVKHAAAINYEEGFLIELVAINFLGVMMLLAPGPAAPGVARFVIPVAAASVAYLFKSSQVLVWLATVGIVLGVAIRARRYTLASLLLVLALAGPAGWLVHNYTSAGRLTVMSSYDGENMFRGSNAHTLDVYPHCSLDVLFVKDRVCEGQPVLTEMEIGRPGFATEWAWNDAYKARAMDWILQNPAAAAKTVAVKFAVFFGATGLVPYVTTIPLPDGLAEAQRGIMEKLVGSVWVIPARLLEIIVLLASLWLLVRGDRPARATALAILMFVACYSAPYVFGFGHERHFAPMLMMCALSSLFLLSAFIRTSANPRAA